MPKKIHIPNIFDNDRFSEETQPGLMPCKDAAKRLIDLGLIFTPIEEAIQDAVESFKRNGLLREADPQA